jgi:hypothetical protein
MTAVPHAGSRRTVLKRTVPAAHSTRTGVMSTGAFALAAVAVMSIGLLALLVLNTALAKGSFRAHELRVQKADLAQREQLLRTQIEDASSPVTLYKRASELGMVDAVTPVFVRLSDGKVLGVPYAAGTPLDPVTGQPVSGEAPSTVAGPGAAAPEPAQAGPPAAAPQPSAPAATPAQTPAGTPAETPAETPASPGVATGDATDTEQPLGITGR